MNIQENLFDIPSKKKSINITNLKIEKNVIILV